MKSCWKLFPIFWSFRTYALLLWHWQVIQVLSKFDLEFLSWHFNKWSYMFHIRESYLSTLHTFHTALKSEIWDDCAKMTMTGIIVYEKQWKLHFRFEPPSYLQIILTHVSFKAFPVSVRQFLFVCSGLRLFADPPLVEDSPESSAEQEQASSGINDRRVSGAPARPPIRDDGSLDYDGTIFYFSLFNVHVPKEIWVRILYKVNKNVSSWK